MQEEIENRTVNLAISTTRLSFRTLISAGRAYMNHRYRVNAAKKNGKEEEEDEENRRRKFAPSAPRFRHPHKGAG